MRKEFIGWVGINWVYPKQMEEWGLGIYVVLKSPLCEANVEIMEDAGQFNCKNHEGKVLP